MKKLLLATVATIALSASGAIAAEPSAHGSGGGMKAGAEMKGQPAGAELKGQAAGKAETTGSGAASSDSNAGTEVKPRAAPKAASDNKSNSRTRSETTGAGAESPRAAESPKAAEPKAGSNTTIKSQSGAADNKAGSGSSATTGSTAGASVSLTSEQKTKIRTTVIQSSSAPKVERSKINFSLNIGTAVPRSIRFVDVPPTLVEIHPQWRGYRYFVVEEEIVIVDPRTMQIVAILTV